MLPVSVFSTPVCRSRLQCQWTSDCKWPTDECWVEINENSPASEAVYKVHM